MKLASALLPLCAPKFDEAKVSVPAGGASFTITATY